jgi:Abnormal spindle-like microcephaly-assoc'd, ASPM-SPD-2-Hydin
MVVASIATFAAGCSQIFGIDSPNPVADPVDATAEGSSSGAGEGGQDVTTAGDTATETGTEGSADAPAEAGVDAGDATSSADASDASTMDTSDASQAPDADAGDAGDAATAADACAPSATLFPSTGSVYCPQGPGGATLRCMSGEEQCCYGGSIDGGFASSTCAPLGSTCTNGSNPKLIECEDPADCADAGSQCCVAFNSPFADACGNLHASLVYTLCQNGCSSGQVPVCESPLECASGMQCLPIRASSITFAYCANSSFAVSPPVAAFGTVTVGTTSAAMTLSVKNNSTTAQSVSVAVGGPAPPFAFTLNECTTPVLAGLECDVSVTFNPTATGAVNGTLVVTSGGAPVATALLTGTGQ